MAQSHLQSSDDSKPPEKLLISQIHALALKSLHKSSKTPSQITTWAKLCRNPSTMPKKKHEVSE